MFEGLGGKWLIVYIVMNIEYWLIEWVMLCGIIFVFYGVMFVLLDVLNFFWVEYGMCCGMLWMLDMFVCKGMFCLVFINV